jgi:hypothetical protein
VSAIIRLNSLGSLAENGTEDREFWGERKSVKKRGFFDRFRMVFLTVFEEFPNEPASKCLGKKSGFFSILFALFASRRVGGQ